MTVGSSRSLNGKAGALSSRPAEHHYLTTEELSDRYRGAITVRTLTNWRSQGLGPSFVKIGKAVLYRLDAVELWEAKNTVTHP